jgi:para-aminobenzoate synthetase component 1
MIVDLVRNDLSRVAKRGSVHVSELFGVYSFKTVHHLISTVEAELKEDLDSWDAIKATFPMGSMTGAPKISAMKLIERYENFKRGAYSGAFGIMQPNGDFDFNVLIRTLLFDKKSKRLAFGVGSAITIQADPIKEYKECLLKAEALMQSLRKPENELRGEIQS